MLAHLKLFWQLFRGGNRDADLFLARFGAVPFHQPFPAQRSLENRAAAQDTPVHSSPNSPAWGLFLHPSMARARCKDADHPPVLRVRAAGG